MPSYILTASLADDEREVTVEAWDRTDATFAAIREVLDLAYDEQDGPWARGHIELRDSEGALLHSMAAKGEGQ